MKIKTYIVPTLSEAVEKIKRDLGPEAVILSTKKSQADKWWLGQRPQLEVTAAIDAASPAFTEPVGTTPAFGQTTRLVNRITENQIAPLREELMKLRQVVANRGSISTTVAPTSTRKAEAQAVQEVAKTPVAPINRAHKSPLLFPEMVSQEWVSELQRHGEDILTVCRTLLSHRVHARVVQELADHMMEIQPAQSLERMKEYAAEWLMKQIPDVARFDPDNGRDRIFMVLGPTGSGKTTTLVKLASHLALEKKKSVAFVTMDHYRIAAEEQLKQYAAILKAPCRLVLTANQMTKALERLANVDAILIDTAGCSPNDLAGMQRILNHVPGNLPMSRALVLPATLHEPDLEHAIHQFKKADFSQIILTKLDETTCYGSLFNAPHDAGLPLSYFTMGQRVPEDYEEATKERVMDCLLNFSGQFPISEFETLDESGSEPDMEGVN